MDNYSTLSDQESIDKTVSNLAKNNYQAIVVENKAEALAKIIELIPENASVMNGSSTTLEEIGFIDYLKSGAHKWNNLHEGILKETDPEKQELLRKLSLNSDFYLGSTHALTENGEMVFASNTGSQLPHLAYTSTNLIIVVGAQKIVPNLDEAFKRLEQHVIPLEDKRMMGVYGFGTTHAKTLILHKENPNLGRKVQVIIVKEKLGF
jgi:L-lactate utilization protein LutC